MRVFTISTISHVAGAIALGESVRRHTPGATFIIGLIDRLEGRLDPAETGFPVIEAHTFIEPEVWADMTSRYTPMELCAAAKPFLALHLLGQGAAEGADPEEPLVYLDGDILTYSSLEPAAAHLRTASILVTLHIESPPPLDGKLPGEINLLNSGLFNSGFFAVRPGPDTTNFLTWWRERNRLYCYLCLSSGFFVDQIWFNFVPIYFGGVKSLTGEPGWNAAYWNLHERRITRTPEGAYLVNGNHPLVFFHFSGYNPDTPENISRHQTRFALDAQPGLADLFAEYGAELLLRGHGRYRAIKCAYSKVGPLNSPVKVTGWRRVVIRFCKSIIKRLQPVRLLPAP